MSGHFAITLTHGDLSSDLPWVIHSSSTKLKKVMRNYAVFVLPLFRSCVILVVDTEPRP